MKNTNQSMGVNQMKKQYMKPTLTIHGNVEKMTLAASASNRDAAQGNNNTAFPNA